MEGASAELDLKPCEHQAGGHFKSGKTEGAQGATYVDGSGRFYKAVQDDSRGGREAAVYELIFGESEERPEDEKADLEQLRQFVPRFYGVVFSGSQKLLALEDSCHGYRKPCVLDAKMGFTTIYDWADDKYKVKTGTKDQETTQAALGYRVTGFKVYQRDKADYFVADRLYGKALTPDTMAGALALFGSNGRLTPKHVYGGPSGALAKLRALEQWFAQQRTLCFYAASVIIMYEGDAESAEEADVRLRWIDFAHTFPSPGRAPDDNVHRGLRSLIGLLEQVAAQHE